MDTNGDAQFFTWDLEHDATWKKLVNFETTKSVSASTFDARTGDVYLQDGSFNINKMDLDTGKTLATIPASRAKSPCGIWSTAWFTPPSQAHAGQRVHHLLPGSQAGG